MTRNAKYCAGVFAMVVLLGLIACNSGSTGNEYQFKTEQSSATDDLAGYDACVLVTKTDAEAVLGEPVDLGKGSGTTPLGAKACGYVASAPTSPAMVNIYVGPLSMGAESNMWEAQKKLWSDRGIQTVSGLGQDAFLASDGLHVLTPKATLDVSVRGLKGESAITNAEKILAQKAVSRM